MPLSDHYRGGATERLLVSILTVDPASGRVEVVGKDAAVIQIGVGRVPAIFRWPVQGEVWTIIRENGEWSLESKVSDPDSKSLSTLNPGEAMVQADKIWTPSGEYLVTSDEGLPSGGTIGQVLAKNSNADWDTQWTSIVPDPPEAVRYVGAAGQPALQNSWIHYDSNSATPLMAGQRDVRFWRHHGHVYLAGLCKNGTASTIAFTLPVGYRPADIGGGNQLILPVVSNGLFGAILIYANGDVSMWQGSTAYFSLDGVVFRHA
jgi:hypothetical protein